MFFSPKNRVFTHLGWNGNFELQLLWRMTIGVTVDFESHSLPNKMMENNTLISFPGKLKNLKVKESNALLRNILQDGDLEKEEANHSDLEGVYEQQFRHRQRHIS